MRYTGVTSIEPNAGNVFSNAFDILTVAKRKMDNKLAETGGLTGLLEQAVNAAVSLDPEFPPKLSAFEGRRIAVDVLGLEYRIFVTVVDRRLRLTKTAAEPAEVTVRGAPLALLKLATAENPAALLQSGEVKMDGDVELGRRFKAMLGELDIDWEELLAQRIGDLAAHKLGNLARGFLGWRRHAHASFATSLGEYLQEEVRHTPARIEVENFMDDVDALREAADRIEARIELLMKRKSQMQHNHRDEILSQNEKNPLPQEEGDVCTEVSNESGLQVCR